MKKHNEPTDMTPEQLATAGKEIGCMRVIMFENGIVSDGSFAPEKMGLALVAIMLEQPELAQMFRRAVKLHKKVKHNPLAPMGIKMALSGKSVDELLHDNCDCAECTARREFENRIKEN